MAKYTYPIVFILNEETKYHNGYIPDLAVFSEGQNKEEVYEEMMDILKNFIALSIKYDSEVPRPSTLDDITKKWPGFKVSLITAEL